MSQIDLSGSSFRRLTAEDARQRAVASESRSGGAWADKARSWVGRILESTVYGILILPFAVVVCAIVAFAVLPLHSDSRSDDGSE